MGAPNKRKSEASIGSNPFPGMMPEKKFSSHSGKKKVNIEINLPIKKAPPVPTHGHKPLQHFQTANYGQKVDLGSFAKSSSPSKIGGNEILS